MNAENERREEHIARLVRDRADNPPNDVQEHLAGVRRQVLTMTSRSRRAAPMNRWMMPVGAAIAAMAAFVLVFPVISTTQPLPKELTPRDAMILVEGEPIELIEDLEFYAWLKEEMQGTSRQEERENEVPSSEDRTAPNDVRS